MYEPETFQFRLRTLLLVVVSLCCTVAMLINFLAVAHKQSLKSNCKGNLKNLGNYITLYASRYGSDRDFPGPFVLMGSGAPTPAGGNGVFWSTLYRVPNQTNAVSQRPGDCGIYVCKVRKTQPTTTALEYTCPNFGAVWPAGNSSPAGKPMLAFPGGLLSDAVRGDTPIGGDLIGPSDTPNHGGLPGAPTDDWNCLFFDGHVDMVLPGSLKHTLYALMTTGVRTR
ncbi:MAG: hypothetical protein HYZ53_25285 [Planctomycetes bacterium]|nr:hypothetical protein [Planctomycetota bacterium]